jgi:anti-sigma factor RsiW
MIAHETQLKLQALLDGELPPPEARELERMVAQQPQAQALLTELKNTNQAFRGFGESLQLPESREFYWSKVERAIRAEKPAPHASSAFTAWRRFLLPAGAFAAVVVAGLLASHRQTGGLEAESVVADPGAFTYRDFRNRTTLVWLSYPAENELASNDAGDTLE